MPPPSKARKKTEKAGPATDSPSVSPSISGPSCRLIHRGTLGIEASVAGLAERYGRGRTSHAAHVWWARRPHAAMRSLIYETLCRTVSAETQGIAVLLAAGDESDSTIARAKKFVGGGTVLDMFGGGGTIPFEAARLGAKACSIDNNELSVFVQTSNLELSQAAFKKMTREKTCALLETSGRDMLARLRQRTDDLYARRPSGTFAYFWSYAQDCGDCGYGYHLSKRPWLSRKNGKTIGFKAKTGRKSETSVIADEEGLAAFPAWQKRSLACPKCAAPQKADLKKARDVLMAGAEMANPRGKKFSRPQEDDVPPEAHLARRRKALLRELKTEVPESRLPKWSGIVNPSLYGMERHGDIFNARQTVVLLEIAKALRETHVRLMRGQGRETADFITSQLSSLIDQYVDWNCRLSMWISQNEQVGRALSGPGVPMLWDYVETDALMDGPANLHDKLSRIVAAVRSMPVFDHAPAVRRAQAQDLPWKAGAFDAVITDPPYYDNMFYNVLADFIYTWKRLALLPVFPALFAAPQTADKDELVASTIRQGGAEAAHEWYCRSLTRALREAARVLKADGVLSFVYAHSSFNGWAAIVTAFRDSGLHIDTVEPLSIERRARPRAMTSEAVNTCVVLVAGKNRAARKTTDAKQLEKKIAEDIRKNGTALRHAGWADADIGMAIFAKAVAAIANAREIKGLSDMQALEKAAARIGLSYPGFKIARRKPL